MRKLLLWEVIASLALTACGKDTTPVPNVVGQRLDLAKSHLEDSGLKSEPIGGGVFGVLNESNWTVCQQEPSPGTTGADTVKLIVERVCDESGGPTSGSTGQTP